MRLDLQVSKKVSKKAKQAKKAKEDIVRQRADERQKVEGGRKATAMLTKLTAALGSLKAVFNNPDIVSIHPKVLEDVRGFVIQLGSLSTVCAAVAAGTRPWDSDYGLAPLKEAKAAEKLVLGMLSAIARRRTKPSASAATAPHVG